MHAAELDAVEYLPAAHAWQLDAPGLNPVFVIDPAAQTTQPDAAFTPSASAYWPTAHCVQASTSDAAENFPAAHAVHAVAPTLGPVLVMDPAAQSMQLASPSVCVYLPAAHILQNRSPVPAYLPARHELHSVAAPTDILPSAQSLQLLWPSWS